MDKEIISNEWIENNAWLIFRADFYPIYTEWYWLWLSTDEKLILSFIYYWTKNGQWIYATNLQIAMLIESSESTAKRCLKSLKEKWFVSIVEKKTQTGTDRRLKFTSQSLAQFKNELSAQVKLTRAQRSNWPTEKNKVEKNKKDLSKDKSADADVEQNDAEESKLDEMTTQPTADTATASVQTSGDENKNTPPDLTFENILKYYYKRNDRKININKCKKAFNKKQWDKKTYEMFKASLIFFKRDKKLKITDKDNIIWSNLETLIEAFEPDRLQMIDAENRILEKLYKLYKEDREKYNEAYNGITKDLPWMKTDIINMMKERNRVQICLK